MQAVIREFVRSHVVPGPAWTCSPSPRTRTASGWTAWESKSGAKVLRGGPGSTMFVPPGCPHAFANPGTAPARMIFLFAPPGHERYLRVTAELGAQPGPPGQAAIAELRARYNIKQLTPLVPGRGDH